MFQMGEKYRKLLEEVGCEEKVPQELKPYEPQLNIETRYNLETWKEAYFRERMFRRLQGLYYQKQQSQRYVVRKWTLKTLQFLYKLIVIGSYLGMGFYVHKINDTDLYLLNIVGNSFYFSAVYAIWMGNFDL